VCSKEQKAAIYQIKFSHLVQRLKKEITAAVLEKKSTSVYKTPHIRDQERLYQLIKFNA